MKTSVEKTLLRLVADYERSAGAKRTCVQTGEVVLRVMYRTNGRDEFFVIRGSPNKKGDQKKLDKALSQFKKSIRFVYLRSGESLSNFMSGAFKELLHTVLQEHLSSQVEKAQQHRKQYVTQLMGDLLTPLGTHALEQLSEVMREITSIEVNPFVPTLDDTLSRADITVTDTAQTALVNKGTGVRGALLVALLSYLARHSKRSLILAVEEPESFLHPRAQEELLDDLCTLAKRKDVTLMVTTHSPFMLDRSSTTRITCLHKDAEGRTEVGKQIPGNSPHAAISSCLFADSVMPSVLDAVQPLTEGVSGVIFVEGYTDKAYIEAAARVAGRLELLEGIEIRHDDGAHKTAVQAILLRQLVGSDLPIAVLLDHDEPGKSAAGLLTDKFHWRGPHVIRYNKWIRAGSMPIEAEDMFPQTLLEQFIDAHSSEVLAEKVRLADKSFHYGFTQSGKKEFLKFIEKKLSKGHTERWVAALEDIRKILKLDQSSSACKNVRPVAAGTTASMLDVAVGIVDNVSTNVALARDPQCIARPEQPDLANVSGSN